MTTITQENKQTTLIPAIGLNEPEMKTVYRGYCVRTDLSLTLDEETLYYLEYHNKTHFYVSKFPSASKSQMGVYEASRFKVVKEELVPVNPVKMVKTPTKTLEQKLREQDEVDCAQNTIFFFDGNEQEEEVEPVKAKDLMFAEHFQAQDLEALPKQFPTLEQGKLYQAKLIYRSVAFAHHELGRIYYIAAKDLDSSYYNDATCLVYEDAERQIPKGAWSTRWFEILNTVEDPHVEKVSTEEVQAEQLESAELVYVEVISEPQELVTEVATEIVEPVVEEVKKTIQGDVKELLEEITVRETANNKAPIEKTNDAESILTSFNLFEVTLEANNNSKSKRKKQIEFNLFDI